MTEWLNHTLRRQSSDVHDENGDDTDNYVYGSNMQVGLNRVHYDANQSALPIQNYLIKWKIYGYISGIS